MGSHTTTTLAAFIPEVWLMKTLPARESPLLISKRCLRVMKEATLGDIFHFPNIANISASSVSADGTVTNTANTETDTTVTVDQWRATGIDIPNNLWRQASQYDLAAKYGPKLMYGVAVDVEDQVFDLDAQAGITTNGGGTVGTAATGFADANLLQAIRVLDGADVPLEDRSIFVRPQVIERMRYLDKFVSAHSTGAEVPAVISGVFGGRPPANLIKERFAGTVYGVPIWWTNRNNANGSGFNNWIMHAEAVALVLQKDVSITDLPVPRLSKNIVADAMFGRGVTRGNHAVVLIT